MPRHPGFTVRDNKQARFKVPTQPGKRHGPGKRYDVCGLRANASASWKPNGQHSKPEKIQDVGSDFMLYMRPQPKGLSSVNGVLPHFVIQEAAVDAKQL